MSTVPDEYGVYERLARLETQHDAMDARLKIAEKPADKPAASSGLSGLSLPNPIVWIMIIATALGQGPQVLELVAKVLTNAH